MVAIHYYHYPFKLLHPSRPDLSFAQAEYHAHFCNYLAQIYTLYSIKYVPQVPGNFFLRMCSINSRKKAICHIEPTSITNSSNSIAAASAHRHGDNKLRRVFRSPLEQT